MTERTTSILGLVGIGLALAAGFTWLGIPLVGATVLAGAIVGFAAAVGAGLTS